MGSGIYKVLDFFFVNFHISVQSWQTTPVLMQGETTGHTEPLCTLSKS